MIVTTPIYILIGERKKSSAQRFHYCTYRLLCRARKKKSPHTHTHSTHKTHKIHSPERRERRRKNMSVRGTLQLSKMSIFYCPRTGTSRGVLRFLDRLNRGGKDDDDENTTTKVAASSERRDDDDDDVVFKRVVKKGVFSVHQTRGRDPHLRCVYLSGKEKTIDLKNKSEEEVARLVAAAASEKGGKKKITKGGRVRRTRRESVQGAWAAGGP